MTAPAIDTLDDHQLMAQIQAGGTDAFGELHDRYAVRALRVARSVSVDHAHAEDAVQDAFLAVWRSRASYEPRSASAASWLLSIVRHRAIDLTRRDVKQRAVRSPDFMLDGLPSRTDLVGAAESQYEADSLLARLAQLPAPQREVITLAYYGQLSHLEIAEHLAVPLGTIKGRMRLGLNKLRDELNAAA